MKRSSAQPMIRWLLGRPPATRRPVPQSSNQQAWETTVKVTTTSDPGARRLGRGDGYLLCLGAFLSVLLSAPCSAIEPSPEETALAQRWVERHFGWQGVSEMPFSFLYGGTPSANLITDWEQEVATQDLDGQRTRELADDGSMRYDHEVAVRSSYQSSVGSVGARTQDGVPGSTTTRTLDFSGVAPQACKPSVFRWAKPWCRHLRTTNSACKCLLLSLGRRGQPAPTHTRLRA